MRVLPNRPALIVVLAVVAATSAWGLSLEPLSHVFGLSASDRVHTYHVTNTQEREIAVRIRVTTREQRPDGEEIRRDASDHWLVFPARLSLAPGQRQAVRVQYTGPADVRQERAFRVIAEQLPIDISEGDRRSGINVLFRYEASAYVREGRFAPDVRLAATERQFDAENMFRGILVRLENRGTTHAILHNLVFHLTRTNEDGIILGEFTFAEEDLSVLSGRNLLAGHVLEEVLPLPDTWSEGTFDVQYTVELLD